MALNPPLFDARTPSAQRGEVFLCSRAGIAFEGRATGLPKLSAPDGEVYLTTKRLVFAAATPVPLGGGATLRSFEMPLAQLSGEQFQQPFFGANYLEARVEATPGRGIDAPTNIKMWFYKGGAGTFLRVFFAALVEARQPPAAEHPLARAIQSGAFAVADPNDPCVLFVTPPNIPLAQPVPAETPPASSATPRVLQEAVVAHPVALPAAVEPAPAGPATATATAATEQQSHGPEHL